jgi:hypothetical protein
LGCAPKGAWLIAFCCAVLRGTESKDVMMFTPLFFVPVTARKKTAEKEISPFFFSCHSRMFLSGILIEAQ